MSILDKLETRDLRQRRQGPTNDLAHEPYVNVCSESAPYPPRHNSFTYEEAYETRLEAHTTWYANSAQYESRRSHAEKELLHHVYGPVLSRLNRLRSAAYDRDFERVLLEVEDVEKEILG